MKKEIKIIWRFAYAKLFDMESALWVLKDKKGEFKAKKLIWRIYWLTKLTKQKYSCCGGPTASGGHQPHCPILLKPPKNITLKI